MLRALMTGLQAGPLPCPPEARVGCMYSTLLHLHLVTEALTFSTTHVGECFFKLTWLPRSSMTSHAEMICHSRRQSVAIQAAAGPQTCLQMLLPLGQFLLRLDEVILNVPQSIFLFLTRAVLCAHCLGDAMLPCLCTMVDTLTQKAPQNTFECIKVD